MTASDFSRLDLGVLFEHARPLKGLQFGFFILRTGMVINPYSTCMYPLGWSEANVYEAYGLHCFAMPHPTQAPFAACALLQPRACQRAAAGRETADPFQTLEPTARPETSVSTV